MSDVMVSRTLFAIGFFIAFLSLLVLPTLILKVVAGSKEATSSLALDLASLGIGLSICVYVAMSVRASLRGHRLSIAKLIIAWSLIFVAILSIYFVSLHLSTTSSYQSAGETVANVSQEFVTVTSSSATFTKTSFVSGTVSTSVGKRINLIEMNRSIRFVVSYHVYEQPNYDYWRKDLEMMKRMGFDTVRVFYVAPSNALTYGGDVDTWTLDQFLKLCDELGMKVVITIAQYPPPWAEENVLMHDQRGKVFGWFSPCSKQFVDMMKSFARKIVEVARKHPSVVAYNVFNELHMPENMYWHNTLCDYSKECVEMFRRWCLARYGDSLCNASIPRPRSENWLDWSLDNATWVEMWIRWRIFSQQIIANVTHEIASYVKSLDPSRLVIVNEMPWWFWSQGGYSATSPRTTFVSRSIDVAAIDIYPAESGGEWIALALDSIRSMSGKKVAILELNDKEGDPTKSEVVRWVIMALQMGSEFVGWFEWDDLFAQMDGGRYGIVDEFKDLKEVGNYISSAISVAKKLDPCIKQLSSAYLEQRAKVAMLYSEPSHVLVSSDWFVSFDWLAMYTLFSQYLGYKIDFVYADDMNLVGDLTNYSVLLAIGEPWIGCKALREISNWVYNGGILIVDAGFAYLNKDCRDVVNELLGVEKRRIDFAVRGYAYPLCLGKTCTVISGYREEIEPSTAKVLVEYNGIPLVLINEYGRGKVVFFTMPLTRAYDYPEQWRNVMAKILEIVGVPRGSNLTYAMYLLREIIVASSITNDSKGMAMALNMCTKIVREIEDRGYVSTELIDELERLLNSLNRRVST